MTGIYFTDFVRTRFLDPLGMKNTRFSDNELDSSLLTRGHRKVDGAWQPLEFSQPGEFSALGGLFSTVEDLAIWIGGMGSAFDPHPDTNHPLSRASRREMQQGYRIIPPSSRLPFSDPASDGETLAYGFGLVNESDVRFGVTAGHSGGYPGYGSHMRWHPQSGWGIVALGNRTYAPMMPAASEAMNIIIRDHVPARTYSESDVWFETASAMNVVEELLTNWDNQLADDWFAVNMDLDQPRNERMNAILAQVESGTNTSRVPGSLTTTTPAHAKWQVTSDSGLIEVELLMSPTTPPKIQTLKVAKAPQ